MVFALTEKIILSVIMAFLTIGGSQRVFASWDSNENIVIPLFTIDKGFRSGIKERKLIVIKTEKEWENLWQLHKAPFVSKKQIPFVNFEQEMIVVVFSGEKKTGGYEIEIKKIEENRENKEFIVIFLETQPLSKNVVIQALTQPYHIVKTRNGEIAVTYLTMPITPYKVTIRAFQNS